MRYLCLVVALGILGGCQFLGKIAEGSFWVGASHAANPMDMSGCAEAPKTVSTRVDPATVSLSRHVQGQDATETKIVVKSVPVASAITAGTQPVSVEGISIEAEGKKITAPAGSTVEVTTGTPAKSDVESSASAAGATVRTDGDAGKLVMAPPEVSLGTDVTTGAGGVSTKDGKSGAKGGSLEAVWTVVYKAVSSASAAQHAFWAIGICLWLGCLGYWVVERVFHGTPDLFLIAVGVGSGLGFMITGFLWEKAPWILVLLGLGIAAGVVWYVWRWKQKETPMVVKPVTAVTVSGGTV